MANKLIKFAEDIYPFGTKGDIRPVADEDMDKVDKFVKKHKLRNAYEDVTNTLGKTITEADEKKELELTPENIGQYVKSHKRADLNDEALAAGVESPEDLPNATAVAQAILDKKS